MRKYFCKINNFWLYHNSVRRIKSSQLTIFYVTGRKKLVITMDMKSIIEALKCYEGTVKEMQLRFMLHEMRKAADEGESGVSIPMYKIPLHMPTLEHEILEPAGFKTSESKEKSGVKKLHISWQ